MGSNAYELLEALRVLIDGKYTEDGGRYLSFCVQHLCIKDNAVGFKKAFDEIDKEPIEMSCVFHFILKLRLLERAIEAGLKLNHLYSCEITDCLKETAVKLSDNIEKEIDNDQFALAFKIWMQQQFKPWEAAKNALFSDDKPDIFNDDSFGCYSQVVSSPNPILRKGAAWATPIIIAGEPTKLIYIIRHFGYLCTDRDSRVKAVAFINLPFVIELINALVEKEDVGALLVNDTRTATTILIGKFCDLFNDDVWEWEMIRIPKSQVAAKLMGLANKVLTGQNLLPEARLLSELVQANPYEAPEQSDEPRTIERWITEFHRAAGQDPRFPIFLRSKFDEMILTVDSREGEKHLVKLVRSTNQEWPMTTEELKSLLQILVPSKWMRGTAEMKKHQPYFDKILLVGRWERVKRRFG